MRISCHGGHDRAGLHPEHVRFTYEASPSRRRPSVPRPGYSVILPVREPGERGDAGYTSSSISMVSSTSTPTRSPRSAALPGGLRGSWRRHSRSPRSARGRTRAGVHAHPRSWPARRKVAHRPRRPGGAPVGGAPRHRSPLLGSGRRPSGPARVIRLHAGPVGREVRGEELNHAAEWPMGTVPGTALSAMDGAPRCTSDICSATT